MYGLAIDRRSQHIYIGTEGNYRLLPPPAIVAPIRFFIENEEITGPDYSSPAQMLVFHEVSSDEITKIKRGFVYQASHTQGGYVLFPTNSGDEKRQGDQFFSQSLIAMLNTNPLPDKVTATIGSKECFSIGELVAIEPQFDGRELLVFRMRQQFGVLPILVGEKIPKESRENVEVLIDKVIQGYRTSPAESVIDRCEQAIIGILNAYLGLAEVNLGELIKKVDVDERLMRKQKSSQRTVVGSLAHIIGRLHARAKPEEQKRQGLPPISDREADLSVNALGSALVLLGYGRW